MTTPKEPEGAEPVTLERATVTGLIDYLTSARALALSYRWDTKSEDYWLSALRRSLETR